VPNKLIYRILDFKNRRSCCSDLL